MGSKYCPSDFKPSEYTFSWARSKGITNSDFARELEKMMDFEFRRPYSDWDRVCRNWMRRAIELGHVTPEVTLDSQAEDLGITRQPGEDDASLKSRIGIAMTMKAYSLKR